MTILDSNDFESREELEISPKDGFNFVNKIKTILILTMIVNVSAWSAFFRTL